MSLCAPAFDRTSNFPCWPRSGVNWLTRLDARPWNLIRQLKNARARETVESLRFACISVTAARGAEELVDQPSAPEVVAIQARLRDLELETSGLVRRLREAPEVELVGAHLVLEAGGKEVLLGAAAVEEVVRVVALQNVPGVGAAVAGAFTCRGRSLFALELAALLEGRAAAPVHLDAHLVVLGTSSPLALLVDRVKAVVTSGVTLVGDERRSSSSQTPERRAHPLSRLVARVGDRVMPLIDPGQLASFLQGRSS